MTKFKKHYISYIITFCLYYGLSFGFSTNAPKLNGSISTFDKLWELQDSSWAIWSGMGFCRNGENLLEYAGIGRKDTCIRRRCIYSIFTNTSIDTSELLLSNKNIPCTQDMKVFQPSGGQISTTTSGQDSTSIPLISFIFILHNNPNGAMSSILEVWRTLHEVSSAEFIVVDDGSTTEMSSVQQLLNELQILFGTKSTWLSNNSELGYATSCNKALSVAKGKYTLFLLMNSDVIIMIMSGYITLLLRTMEGYRDTFGDSSSGGSGSGQVGMVGPLLLSTDGKVIESGSMIYRGGKSSGGGGGMGRGLYPRDIPYLHTRVVDYIGGTGVSSSNSGSGSGACVLVRSEVFFKLKLKFDVQFESMEYMLADVAMTLLSAGYITVVQPLAVAVAVGVMTGSTGSTSGTPGPTGSEVGTSSAVINRLKKQQRGLQRRNQRSFIEKHTESKLNNYCPTLNQPIQISIKSNNNNNNNSNNNNNDKTLSSSTTVTSVTTLTMPKCPSKINENRVHEYNAFIRQNHRILVLIDHIPQDDRNSASVRLVHILNILVTGGYSVTNVTPVRYLLRLLCEGVNVVVPGTLRRMVRGLYRTSRDSSSASSRGKGRGKNKDNDNSNDINNKDNTQQDNTKNDNNDNNDNNPHEVSIPSHKCPYEIIFISTRNVYSHFIKLIKLLCPNTPIIFDTVDVHFLRESRSKSYIHTRAQQQQQQHISKSTSNLTSNIASTSTSSSSLHISGESQKKFKMPKVQEVELDFMRMSRITFVVSDYERDMLLKMFKIHDLHIDIRILSNIYRILPEIQSNTDTSISIGSSGIGNNYYGNSSTSSGGAAEGNGSEKRSGAVFVGNMCHEPNIHAIEFILRHIVSSSSNNNDVSSTTSISSSKAPLPHILPAGFIIHLVLSNSDICNSNTGTSDSIMKELESHPLIKVHKDISNDELLSLHNHIKLVLAPIPYGAGVKGKINYALQHGVPVIASTAAVEGMHLQHGKSVWIADTGEEFISAIVHLHQSNESSVTSDWSLLRQGGYSVMRRYFSYTLARKTLFNAFESIGISSSSSSIGGGSGSNRLSLTSSGNNNSNIYSTYYWKCPYIDEMIASLPIPIPYTPSISSLSSLSSSSTPPAPPLLSQLPSLCFYDDRGKFKFPHPFMVLTDEYLSYSRRK
eukprot:gene373-680_t